MLHRVRMLFEAIEFVNDDDRDEKPHRFVPGG